MLVWWQPYEAAEEAPTPDNVIDLSARRGDSVIEAEVVASDDNWNARIEALRKKSDETDALFNRIMGPFAKKKRARKTPAIIVKEGS
jgi:hypothetical protein